MNTPPDPPQFTERILKYLPALLLSHMLITVPTFVISIVLAYATYVQANATRKIQQSETWPYISYGTSNATEQGSSEISFALRNDGVGPARIKQVEFTYAGRPMPSPRAFLQQCCGDSADKPVEFMSSQFEVVLRPGQTTQFIRLPERPENQALWNRLEMERWKVVVRVCYCSIFDDCWILDSRTNDPQPVEVCPGNWARFEERPIPRLG